MSDDVPERVCAAVRGFTAALSRITEWIGTMETHPGTWGGAEALELQFLNLIEIRQLMQRPAALAANPYETRDAYIKFIRLVNGEPNNGLLGCILRDAGMLDQLPKLLGDFGRWVAQQYPPEAS